MARKDPLSHLGRHAGALPDGLTREIRALGGAVVPALCAMATDRAGWSGTGPAANAAWHAIALLGERREPAARAAVLEVFRTAPPGTAVLARAGWVLPRFGDVVEDVLPLATEGDRVPEATEVLVRSGAREARVLERVAALVAADPRWGADLASQCADPALLPALRAAFEALFARFEDVEAIADIAEAMAACGEPEAAMHALVTRVKVRGEADIAARKAELAELRTKADALEALVATQEAVRAPGRRR